MKVAKTTTSYEFGGPWGTGLITITLPMIVVALGYWSDQGYVDLSPFMSVGGTTTTTLWDRLVWNPKNSTTVIEEDRSWIWLACGGSILGWFGLQMILERCLPCEIVTGVAPHHLPYRINGHLAFWVTLFLFLHGWPRLEKGKEEEAFVVLQWGSFPYWQFLYDYFAPLAITTSLFCYLLATYLYMDSFSSTKKKVLATNTGNFVYDFFLGRELNPRLFRNTFDWKEFCELRPGLIGWLFLDIACANCQYQHLGYVSNSMILLLLFQGFYVWDALYYEKAILTTMDITTDGFGFMLVFGDLAWVPFTYSIQARYLVHHDPQLSPLTLVLILVVYGIGFWIFRGANHEKDIFRKTTRPEDMAKYKVLNTQRGTALLLSGWWGLARKINYTGDWIMGLSWCLLCGFDSIVPYYYAIYFAILLWHRSIRDDHLCQQKYGNDWETYKKLVPYKFIPGII
jgi:delta14-sterol reductase/lamin-B receptor